jgi:hypothetical protein
MTGPTIYVISGATPTACYYQPYRDLNVDDRTFSGDADHSRLNCHRTIFWGTFLQEKSIRQKNLNCLTTSQNVKITDINFWLQPEFLNELGFF